MGGICGMGMAPLAAFMADEGRDVAGWDDCPDPVVAEYLNRHGAAMAPRPKNFGGAQVVISSALKKSAREFERLGAKSVELRGERWAKICAKRRLAAVAGSHGKSTVSALSAHAAAKFGLGAGWLVGAVPNAFEMHKYCPEGARLISEIDESDGTIENFYPEITVALNADLDHTDTYADQSALEGMFERLFERTKRKIIFPESDAVLRKIAAKFAGKALPVKISGGFNDANKTMAKAAVETMFETALPQGAFDDFKGLRRRQEILAESGAFTAVADYAHHPSEVAAFLKEFALKHKDARLTVLFQPHRYTRTKKFAGKFAEILDACADAGARVAVAEVYPASEEFDPLGSAEEIVKKTKNKSIVLAKGGEIYKIMESSALNGGIAALAVVGAGDIYFKAKKFFENHG